MSNKVLTIELNAETSKLEAKLSAIPKKIEEQVSISKEIAKLEDARLTALKAQENLYTNISNAAKGVERVNGTVLNAFKHSLVGVNKEYTNLKNTITEIEQKIQTLNFAKNLGAGKVSSDNRGYTQNASGTVTEKRQAEAQQAKAFTSSRQAEIIQKEFNLVEAKMAEYSARRKQSQQDLESSMTAIMQRNATSRKQIIQNEIDFAEAARKRELAALRNDIISRSQPKQVSSINAVAQKQVNSELEKTKNHLQAVEKSHKNIILHVGEIISIYHVYNTAIQLTKQALLSIPQAGIQAQATKASIFGIFGSEEGIKNLQNLQVIAQNAGQNIKILEETYRRFAPSAILAGANQEEVNKSFKDFAEVGTILHLPEEKLNSLFLALDQMYAKGTVQSEEIKKQLGNVLPGAVEIGAKAMGKSPAAFLEAMKKNEITAKEFVPKFAALYRQIFGGVDDSVFKNVQDMLFANLQRIQNNWELLARAVYNINETLMNNVAKTIRDGLATVKENLVGISQAVEIIGGLIVARLGLASLEAAANIGLLVSKLASFTTILTGLSPAMLATVSASIALYTHINDLSLAYDKATGFTITYKDQTVSLTSYLSAVGNSVLDSTAQAYNGIADALQRLTSIDVKSLWENILPNKTDIADFLGYVNVIKNSIPSANGMRLAIPKSDDEAFADAREKFLKSLDAKQQKLFDEAGKNDAAKYAESFAGKSATAVSDAIAAGKLKTVEEITNALAKVDYVAKPNLPTVIEEPKIDKSKVAAQKAAQKDALMAQYQEISTNMEKIRGAIKEKLDETDLDFQNNLLSLREYYSKKQELLQQDAEAQFQALEDQKALALDKKDYSKAQEYETKLQKALNTENHKSAIILKEQEKAYKELTTTLSDVNSEYSAMIGKSGSKDVIDFDNQKRQTIEKLMAEYKDMQQPEEKRFAAADGLKQIASLRNYTAVVGEAKEALVIYGQAKDDLALKEERIQNSLRSGAITELQALFQTEEARKQAITTMEQEIEVQEKLLNGQPENSSAVRAIKRLRVELEGLKADSNLFADKFQNIFTQNLSNSFSSFASGAMTAKEAFNSFAQGVIKNIADIVAQEASSAIIKALVGGLKGAFGSSGEENSAGFASLISGAFSGAANGAATTGLSSVSGTILSIPTLFPSAKVIPFASGGVLAGEAGKEAVLPLKRGRNGKLGVESNGGTAQQSITNINVSVERSSGSDDTAYAEKIATAIAKRVAKEEIANAARPGNINNRVTKFG